MTTRPHEVRGDATKAVDPVDLGTTASVPYKPVISPNTDGKVNPHDNQPVSPSPVKPAKD